MKKKLAAGVMVLLLAIGSGVANMDNVPPITNIIQASQIKKPTVTTKNTTSSSVKITWKKIDGVTGYKIYRSTKKKSGYKCIKTLKQSKTSYTNKKLKSNKTYYYKVRAYKKSNGKTIYGKYSDIKTVTTKKVTLDAPEPCMIYSLKKGGLNFTFTLPDGAQCAIYRSTELNGNYTYIATTEIDADEYTDTTTLPSTTYYYKLQSVKGDVKSKFSDCLKGTTFPPAGDPANDEEAVSDEISNKILQLMNDERKKQGLQPLTMTTGLNKIAKVRAEDIKTLYEHVRPNGDSIYSLFIEYGVTCTSARGENIMYGLQTVEDFYNVWYNSPGHYANMFHKKYTKVGIAIYVDENGVIYAAQEFSN